MSGVGVLVSDLDNTDREKRLIALQSLDKLDPMLASVHAGAIMRTMCDPYYQSRISIQARHTLQRLLCNNRSEVRIVATTAIAGMLDDDNRRVREEAVHTMGYMDPTLAVAHADAIARSLCDRSDSRIHPAAQSTLINLGRDHRPDVRLAATKPIVEMLSDSNSNVREGAMDTLANMDPLVVALHAGAIVRVLNEQSHKPNKTAHAAAHTLDKLRRDCRQEVHLATAKSIADIIDDSSWIIRQAAVCTLGKLDLVGDLAQYAGVIARMLDDPIDRVYTEAIRALQRQQPAVISQYDEHVARKLGDTRADVRLDAVRTLGHMEPTVITRHIDAIANMLSDIDLLVREAAVSVLSGLNPIEALSPYVESLVKMLDDTLSIRIAICDLLHRLDPGVYSPHADAITQRITDPSAGVRIGVMKMLRVMKPMEFAPQASTIAEILSKQGYHDERDAALDAMNAFIRNLSNMLTDTERSSREEALSVLMAAGEGGARAISMDGDLARLVERARVSNIRPAETGIATCSE